MQQLQEAKKRGETNNHILMNAKGSFTTAEPKDWELMNAFIDKLIEAKEYKFACFASFGIYSGFRLSDLISLTVGDLHVTGQLQIDIKFKREKKTSKVRSVLMSSEVSRRNGVYLEKVMSGNKERLIFGNRHGKKVSKGYMIKKLKALAIVFMPELGKVTSHTLRKTYARHYYESAVADFNKSGDIRMVAYALAELQDDLGHSSQLDTLRYIGLTQGSKNSRTSRF